MNNDLNNKSGGWIDAFRVALGEKGIDHKYAEWHMRRAQAFMRYAGTTDPRGLDRDRVERYLAEVGRQTNLEHWQARQIVDAVRILVEDVAGLGWAKDVDWSFWIGSLREVDAEHRTLYRESHAAKVDFSKYNLKEHGAAPEGLEETLERVRQVVRRRNYTASTERTYVLWNSKFLRFHSVGSPEALAAESVQVYMSFLALKRDVAVSTQRQALNSIMFMFKQVFGMELGEFGDFVKAKRPQRLPVVLTVEEVRRILGGMKGARALMAGLLYGSGLRLMECLRLRVGDVDFGYEQIMVREGKGGKDRLVPLPMRYAERLKKQVEMVGKLHRSDLKAGFGEVFLPATLAKKHPQAAWELKWQYLFPAAKLSVDHRSGKTRRHHVKESG